MSKGRFRLTKKTHLMNRLMQVYSLLLVGIILLVVAALCVFTADSNYKKLMNDMYILENRIHSYATDKENTMSYLYMELASSNAAVDNVRKYLNLSPSEYFEFTQKYWDDYQRIRGFLPRSADFLLPFLIWRNYSSPWMAQTII